MDFLANWTGMIAVGCTLAMAAISATAWLYANRQTRGIRSLGELEADIGRSTSERNSLGEEVARLRADRDALSNLEEQKVSLRNEIALLTVQVETARKRVEEEAEILKKAEELDLQIADRLTRCGEAEQALVNLRDQVATKEAELGRIANELSEKTKLRDTIVPEMTDLTARRDLLRLEAAKALAEMEELSRTRQEAEIRAAEARLRRDAFLEESGHLERRLSELNDVLERAQASKAAVAEIEDAIRNLERTRQEAAGIEAKMVALHAEVTALTSQRDGLAGVRAAVEELSRTRRNEEMLGAEARQRRDVLNEEGGRLERRLSELSQALERAQANRVTVTEMEEATSKLERTRQETASAEVKMAAFQAEIAALTARRDGLASELSSSSRDADKIDEESLGGLTKPPGLLVGAKEAIAYVTEEEALRKVQALLKGRGLVFPDRIINAFHTSLKISAVSPLTVLAGISGTGKSALPRHYAMAMGLPFLQLAVQPRWDSPQDLFGFYNYMEKKYKPTEFVRLMVHLDTKNWPKEAEPYVDHMALVLLDEMNLARVEYYFSEFLSRLEVRPFADNGTEAELEAAEIELDLGLSSPKRIYPVRRLLFVGTMNEDESTQTLSDKVVDRANVFRFPRPKDLQSGTSGAVETTAPERFLPFSVWSRWCHTVNSQAGSRLDGWLRRLNDTMEQAGRPFGHRMARAITAYVANYPVRDAEALAMADQLEMRIFPKLRGVDPKADDRVQRALDELGRFIVTEIRDTKLAEAFDTAKEGDLFAWRGVDRG